jgi:hypothetical protein
MVVKCILAEPVDEKEDKEEERQQLWHLKDVVAVE